VNACIAAASHTEKFAGEKINVCTGTQRSNNSILKFFLDRNDNLKIVNAPKRQGDVDHILGSDIKMRKYLGNCATIRFDEALDITLKSWGL
jgi:nucleoside-diphosphate-sugar epimerase